MLLVLDVSNRQTAVALYNESHRQTWRVATDTDRTADDQGLMLDALLRRAPGYLAQPRLSGAVIGSVVPSMTNTLVDACARYLDVEALVVGPGIRTGVRIRTDNPRELGADRIANALAAFRAHGGPVIVVDFGTAISVDVVSANGDYLGSVIAPGLQMSVDALVARSAQLRPVALARPDRVIGSNTNSAIQSGIVHGMTALVEGLVARIRQELGSAATVVATGQFADLISDNTTVIDVVDADLTLEGLRLIWELNRREPKGGR